MGRFDKVTVPVPSTTSTDRTGLRLVVVAQNEIVSTHVLPEIGDITLGRAKDNAIQIDDDSVSRRHAVLHINRVMTIEDLGSSNGTKLRDVTLAPHKPYELGINESVTLGALTLIVQHRVASGAKQNDESVSGLVIADTAMRELYTLAAQIAPSDLSVLILGETGVGKEKLAQTLHKQSPRANKPFVAFNCAALNDALLESELFGHERGAFTGANAVKQGLLETASGGSVFLDEIGDMSLAIQAKLLRVLEDGQVRRVGGIKPIEIRVRFIAATNTDLEAAVSRGAFREDLYFRLSGATLVIPPLRERPTEVAMLARRFATRVTPQGLRQQTQITNEALELLQEHSWPGNIRELRNVIERALVLCASGPITVDHLPDKLRKGANAVGTTPPVTKTWTDDDDRTTPPVSKTSTAATGDERTRVLAALEQAGGNQSKAAELLGVSRRTLINRMDEFDLPRPRKGRVSSNNE